MTALKSKLIAFLKLLKRIFIKFIKNVKNNSKKYICIILLIILAAFVVLNYNFRQCNETFSKYYIYLNLLFSIFFLLVVISYERGGSIKNKNGFLNLIYIILGALVSITFIVVSLITLKGSIINNNQYEYYSLLVSISINEIIFVFMCLETSNSIFNIKHKCVISDGVDLLSAKSKFNDKFILEKLESAISGDSCFNIAIDGKFASGKSTLINELVSNNKNDYIKCSLETFDNGDKKDDGNENIIGKVLDCILIKKKVTPNYFLGGLITLLLYSIAMMVLPMVKFPFNLVNFVFLSITICSVFYLSTLVCTYMKKGKLSLANNSFEFETKDDTNRKKINDIITLLKKYNKNIVIIFEDLDRFDSIELFSELKELNYILNNTLANKVVFIYALDTSLFSKIENRTKFFDLIVPIVPRLASETAMDFLSGKGLDVNPELLTTVVKCTTNIRELTNICNEFVFIKHNFFEVNEVYYSDKINKIFFMVVLKNLFPLYYEDLFKNNNFLDKIYNSCIKSIIDNSRQDINNIDKPIDYYISYVYANMNNNFKSIVDCQKISPALLSEKINSVVKIKGKDNSKPFVEDVESQTKFRDLISAGLVFEFIGMDYKEYLVPINFDVKNIDDLNRRTEMYNGIVNLDYSFKDAYKILISLGNNMFLQQTILNYSLISELYKSKSLLIGKYSIFRETFIKPNNDYYRFNPLYMNNCFLDLIRIFARNYKRQSYECDREFLLDVAFNSNLKNYLNKNDEDLAYLGIIMNIAMNDETRVEAKSKYISEIVTIDFISKHNSGESCVFLNQFDNENLQAIKESRNIWFSFVKNENEYNHRIYDLGLFDLNIKSINNFCQNEINDIDCVLVRILNNDKRIKEITYNISISKYEYHISLDVLNKILNGSLRNENYLDNFFNKLILKEKIENCILLPEEIKRRLSIFIKKKSINLTEQNSNYIKQLQNVDERKLLYCDLYLDSLINNDILNIDICEKLISDDKYQPISTENVGKLIELNKLKLDDGNMSSKKRKCLLEYANKYDSKFDKIPISVYYQKYTSGDNKKYNNLNCEDIYYDKIKNQNFYPNDNFIIEVMSGYKVENYKLVKKN